jgi:group II intron reverse transcriptase/maturase
MDCIAIFYSRVQPQNKFFWAIEGDIRKCFDRIHHKRLLKELRKRIADERIVQLVKAFLTAGVMEGALFQETRDGTPQGGILSPLLANIYLHQLDLWWWQKFGNLTPGQKQYRRKTGKGNAILVRYADDFVLLWNGTHQGARDLKAELKQFLWEELHLELSEEKTHITHMTDGIDFLGFHIQYMLPSQGRKPWLRVTPTKRNLQRFKAKIKALTRRGTTYATPEIRFKGLNRVIRGWGNYYRHVSFTYHASKLDFWMGQRILKWLRHKHPKRGVRSLLKQYLLREVSGRYNRDNFGVQAINGETVFIAKLGDIRLTPYRWTKRPNPYLTVDRILEPERTETPFLEPRFVNLPPSALTWTKQRARAMRRDKGTCQHCGIDCKTMDVHHIIPREQGGTDDLDNLITLCRECHSKTSSYGFKAKREEKI